MPTEKIEFTDQQAEFIRQAMNDGRYRDASDIVGAALRLLAQREEEDRLKLAALRRLTAAGFEQIDHGRCVDVDPAGIDAFLSELSGGDKVSSPNR